MKQEMGVLVGRNAKVVCGRVRQNDVVVISGTRVIGISTSLRSKGVVFSLRTEPDHAQRRPRFRDRSDGEERVSIEKAPEFLKPRERQPGTIRPAMRVNLEMGASRHKPTRTNGIRERGSTNTAAEYAGGGREHQPNHSGSHTQKIAKMRKPRVPPEFDLGYLW
jgi:hypothetical protein